MQDDLILAHLIRVGGSWSGGVMVLGKFPVPGRPANLD